MLRRFQRAGHRPIALVGGATGMIGDPSGKSEERNLLSNEQLAAQRGGMRAQMRQFLDFDAGANARDAGQQLRLDEPFSYLEFLRDVGKHFPVNVMLAKDSVKSRLERDSGISYTEFSYMLLQAYDFVYLQRQVRLRAASRRQRSMGQHHRRHRSGPPHARRAAVRPHLSAADQERRRKMGKTETGTVWLSAERTSPYQFYQYWINVDDADAGKCLRFLTELNRTKKSNRSTPPAQPIRQARKPAAAGRRADEARSRRRRTCSSQARDGNLLRRRNQRTQRPATRRNLRRCAQPRTAARPT